MITMHIRETFLQFEPKNQFKVNCLVSFQTIFGMIRYAFLHGLCGFFSIIA